MSEAVEAEAAHNEIVIGFLIFFAVLILALGFFLIFVIAASRTFISHHSNALGFFEVARYVLSTRT